MATTRGPQPPAWAVLSNVDGGLPAEFYNRDHPESLQGFLRWLGAEPHKTEKGPVGQSGLKSILLAAGLAMRAVTIAVGPTDLSNFPVHVQNHGFTMKDWDAIHQALETFSKSLQNT
jgi:hypothetical protein